MGIRQEKGFEAKIEEAKRQFDNARRAAHTHIRETRFLWTKKDTTPEGSTAVGQSRDIPEQSNSQEIQEANLSGDRYWKKINTFQKLSDFENELERPESTATTRLE